MDYTKESQAHPKGQLPATLLLHVAAIITTVTITAMLQIVLGAPHYRL